MDNREQGKEPAVIADATTEAQGKERTARSVFRHVANFALFTVAAVAALALLSSLLAPLSDQRHRVATIGFYAQEPNSIQVGCLGPSTSLSGVSPNELYKDFGISAYNCSNGNQPALCAYYMLQDMYRLNAESLKAVVYDPSSLVLDRAEKKKKGAAERNINDMRLSPVKVAAAFEAAKEFNSASMWQVLIPVLRYHARWSDLTGEDFQFMMGATDDYTSRGQYIRYLANVLNGDDWKSYAQSNEKITEEKESSDEYLDSLLDPSESKYVDKMCEFCRDKGIYLVFIQTPREEWTDEMHDSVKQYCARAEVPFIDYNTPDMLQEIGLSYAFDMVDKHHPNIHGAQKLTQHLGSYLASECEFEDMRSGPDNIVLEDCLESYNESLEDAQLLQCSDLEEYLDYLDNDRFTVFVSVKGDAASALSDSAREKIAASGLANLAAIETDQLYIGLVDKGEVLIDERKAVSEKVISVVGAYYQGSVILDDSVSQVDRFSDCLLDMSSSADESVITIGKEDVCVNQRGINFAIYDAKRGELIDMSCFDTHVGQNRTSGRAD